MLWNLGENLESAPAWLRRIFHRRCRDLESLADLPGMVEGISRVALDAPVEKLGDVARTTLVDLSEEDRRFLPGALHFVAPTVVCVHDRQRTAAAGRDPVTVGVWLAESPLLLGPMGCREELAATTSSDAAELWTRAETDDPRVTEPHALVVNEHRAAGTLVTSQQLLVFLPLSAA
jgi:hypothetical protein